MKEDKFQKEYSEFLAIQKRVNEIWDITRRNKREMLVELENPIQDGWTLEPYIREDLLRSDAGPTILRLVNLIAYKGYTRDPNAVRAIRNEPALHLVYKRQNTDKDGKISWFKRGPYLKRFTEKEFEKLKLSDSDKKYFDHYYNYVKPRWGMEERWDKMYYLKVPAYYLIVKVKKRYITHLAELNPELMSEEKFLRSKLEKFWRENITKEKKYIDFAKEFKRNRKEMKSTIKKYLKKEVSEVTSKLRVK